MIQESPSFEAYPVWIESIGRLGFVISPGAHFSEVVYTDIDDFGYHHEYTDRFPNDDLTELVNRQ